MGSHPTKKATLLGGLNGGGGGILLELSVSIGNANNNNSYAELTRLLTTSKVNKHGFETPPTNALKKEPFRTLLNGGGGGRHVV